MSLSDFADVNSALVDKWIGEAIRAAADAGERLSNDELVRMLELERFEHEKQTPRTVATRARRQSERTMQPTASTPSSSPTSDPTGE